MVDHEMISLVRASLKKFVNRFFKLKFNNMSQFTKTLENTTDHGSICKSIQLFIPKLTENLHKGQCGRIGVIGGSFEYTGAPYFAAISSLKLGADLVHVFCCREAGPVIKSYSPELMVHPFLDSEDVVKKIEPWLENLHALVIGPGLGRDKDVFQNVTNIITFWKEKKTKKLPLIIDADGVYLITENLTLLKDYKGPIILTPNVVEFNRLSDKMCEKDPLKISAALNVILLQKGATDVITNGIYNTEFNLKSEDVTIKCDVPGSYRRCGGQGDVLSGCIATLVAWLQVYFSKSNKFNFGELKNKDKEFFLESYMYYSYAAYGGCVVTRTCSRLGFEVNGRSMTTSDMILYINKAFQLHFHS